MESSEGGYGDSLALDSTSGSAVLGAVAYGAGLGSLTLEDGISGLER